MKKITVAFLFLFAAFNTVKAQDYKKAKSAFLLSSIPGGGGTQKILDAKTEVDKLMATSGADNKAENVLLKAQVYAAVVADTTLAAKYPEAADQAIAALNKYLQLEPAETKLKEDRYQGVNQIYSSLFSQGVKYYNNKEWDQAFNKFKKVVDMGELMISRKWTTLTFDTTANLYAGVTAQNAKRDEDAIKHYAALIDQKIATPEYQSVYEFMVRHYLNTNNAQQFQKYYQLGKQYYPKSDLWDLANFRFNVQSKSLSELQNSFAELDKNKQLTAFNYLQYGDYFSNDSSVRIAPDSVRAALSKTAAYSFQRAYELDSSNVIALFNTGVLNFNEFERARDKASQIKGVTPAIKARRAQADKVADAAADVSITWLEKAFNTLEARPNRTRGEEGNRKSTARLLAATFEYKRERAKVIAPKDYDKFDNKVKFYDSKY